MKTVLLEDKMHERVKEFSKKSGMKIKTVVEAALDWYLKHVIIEVQ
jgi:hypothetical protein